MNILLLEDEKAAAESLKKLLEDIRRDVRVVAICESVKESVAWLMANPAPDLIVSDIQLADGISFEIFAKMPVTAPVIFTTAYDSYMLRAFKVNSVDYLLKPIDAEELAAALEKYERLHNNSSANNHLLSMLQQISQAKPIYRTRFLIKQGDGFSYKPTEDVFYIHADDKLTTIHTSDGNKYLVNETLDELEQSLDPSRFFRISRSYITHIDAIESIRNHFNGRLKLKLRYCSDEDVYVSRQRVTDFKSWLNM
ncbi:MAG: LytR/AlgR family response regulator transcription factor [Flavipsychrobacter sp.]